MPLTLYIDDETGAPPQTLSGAVITIGRVVGNDLVVADARVSSRHGRLVRRGEGYAYEDLGSRNGSLVERAGEQQVVAAHAPRAIRAGDRLLLGDLVSPVVIRVLDAPAGGGDAYEGGTVVARKQVADPDAIDASTDPETLRALFRLQRELSGQTDPDKVMERVSDAVLERFGHARAVTVMMRDPQEHWVAECTRTRSGAVGEALPSSTLLAKAVESREVVSYIPGAEAGPASVAGLAGTVLVPLLAGEEAIGVLHVDSRSRPFIGDDLAWLSIAATHVAAALVAARRFRTLSRSADRLREENSALKRSAAMPRPIVGRSPTLMKALKQLERVGRTSTTVLVLGETGTGKELAARYVHAHSPRAGKVFAPVNCGALPEELLNSELFGHRKGAFTGADRDRKGLFEAADGGTVFLDEIGEITPAVQVRLLRVLQEREVQPVGARQPVKVDVRIIAATNRDLQAEVAAGRFREDLYYRLAIFPVELPPLRDREGDIELLAERFRESATARHDCYVNGFTDQAMRALVRYRWPGNVRQLEHELERAVILAPEGGLIGIDELSPQVAGERTNPPNEPTTGATPLEAMPTGQLKDVMGILEERFIRGVLAEYGGNRTRAAEALGISRQALQAKLAKWRKRDD